LQNASETFLRALILGTVLGSAGATLIVGVGALILTPSVIGYALLFGGVAGAVFGCALGCVVGLMTGAVAGAAASATPSRRRRAGDAIIVLSSVASLGASLVLALRLHLDTRLTITFMSLGALFGFLGGCALARPLTSKNGEEP
jgi:hypothetical protein